jgi:hypothetical protein
MMLRSIAATKVVTPSSSSISRRWQLVLLEETIQRQQHHRLAAASKQVKVPDAYTVHFSTWTRFQQAGPTIAPNKKGKGVVVTVTHLRSLSAITATTSVSSVSTSDNTTKGNNHDDKNSNTNNKNSHGSSNSSNSSNVFFDNLGKIFLAVIASVIATLVRSSAGTRNRNLLRDHLEDVAVLDPTEIDDLRVANSELTPTIFRSILQAVYDKFPNGTCSYHEFVYCVRETMARMKGQAFTVELGHLLDRIMVEVLKKDYDNASPDDPNIPVSLFLTTLTLALSSDVRDRIRILYEILQKEQAHHQAQDFGNGNGDQDPSSSSTSRVTIAQVRSIVGYLQETCQLPPDAQIVPTETKYPTQQWKRGGPKDLVPWGDENESIGSAQDLVDLFTFASILRSKSVCAWGECYQKRKFEEEDV